MKMTITDVQSYKIANRVMTLETGDNVEITTVEAKPVEGSAKWALAEMQNGNAVTYDKALYSAHWYFKDGKIWYSHNAVTPYSVEKYRDGEHWLNHWDKVGKESDWKLYTPKPLLADAKVGDYVELREGEIVAIDNIDPPDKTSFAHYIGYTTKQWVGIDGKSNINIPKYDIIRLIPTSTPEWQKIHTAELLEQYPNIERDLRTAKVGDTVLFDNGKIDIVDYIGTCKGGFFNVVNNVDCAGTAQFSFNGKHFYYSTPITCLGIIERAKPKEYSYDEIIKLLESKEPYSVVVKRPDYRSMVMDYCGILRYKDDNGLYPIDKKARNATDWIVVE